MRKLTHFMVGILASLLAMGVFTGCKDDAGKSIADLLKTVPEDAPFVTTFDCDEIISQLGIEGSEGDWTWGPELKNLIKETDADKKDIEKVLNMVMNTSKCAVFFVDDMTPWLTFKVNDEEKFLKFYKSVEDEDAEKEGDFYLLGRHVAMRDGQVWCNLDGRADTDQIKKYANLPADESFLKNNKFAEAMTSGEFQSTAIVNINRVMRIIRNEGSSTDAAMLQSAIALLFDDAAYVTFTGKVTESGCESIMDVLNSDFNPAPCNIPTEKLDMSIFKSLKGSPVIAGGVGISSKLIDQIITAAESFGVRFSYEETDFLKSISGSAAFGISPESQTWAATFTNANAATTGCDYLNNLMGSPLCSASGNHVIFNMGDPVGQGGALKEVGALNGKLGGFVIDFTTTSPKDTNGVDFSSLKKASCVLENNGKGLRLRFNLNTSKPICKILDIITQSVVADFGFRADDYPSADDDFYPADDTLAWEYADTMAIEDYDDW